MMTGVTLADCNLSLSSTLRTVAKTCHPAWTICRTQAAPIMSTVFFDDVIGIRWANIFLIDNLFG
jgi:hypothetical protein